MNDALMAVRMGNSGHDQKPPRHSEPIFNAPGVVVGLIAALVVSHFVIGISPPKLKVLLQAQGAVSPRLLIDAFLHGKVFRTLGPPITHIFIHANIGHLLLNSVWLLAFGAPVARRLNLDQGETRGSIAFLLLFVLSGICGALTFVALHTKEYTLLVGASGAVSGLLGALVRFAFRRPDDGRRYAKLTDRPVIIWSIVILGLNLAIGVLGGLILGRGNDIAWEAHVGGYFFGLLAFPFFDSPPRAAALKR